MRTALLLLSMGPALALASPLEVGAYAGIYLYDDVRDVTTEASGAAPENAPMVGVQATYAPAWLLVALELSGDVQVGEFADGSRLTNVALRLEAKHTFTDGLIRPYLALGPALQLGLTSDFGNDADLAFTAGGGLLWQLARDWGLRFDVHWIAGDGVASVANDFQLTLGATYAL